MTMNDDLIFRQIEMGPMANEAQLDIVKDQVQDAIDKGATIRFGGTQPDDSGYFFQPTVIADADHTMKCMTEETFGPLLPIMPFDDEDEAIRLANDSEYGLTASVWTNDRRRGRRLAERIEAGTVCVNDHAFTYGAIETPWQGVKESGVGCSHSDAGLLEFVYP